MNLTGNTSDQDSDREPEPPTKAKDLPSSRVGKRNSPKEAPAAPIGATTGRGGRRGNFTGSEQGNTPSIDYMKDPLLTRYRSLP